MADTTVAYDLPSWSFVDPMDAQAFQLDPGFAGEENMPPGMTANSFGYAGWDQLESNMAHEMGSGTPAKSDVCYQNYPDRASSIFTDLKAAQNSIAAENFQSVDLDELLRSTSQLATERALYMTTATMGTYASPMMDPCSSPEGSHFSSSTASEADWERELSNATAPLFSLPDTFPPLHPAVIYPDQQQRQHRQRPQTPEGKEGLTPLEMPDGSMRFTANWLPVDPEGGFTITASPCPSSGSRRSPCALEYPDYPQDAFISLNCDRDHGV